MKQISLVQEHLKNEDSFRNDASAFTSSLQRGVFTELK